MVAGSNPVVPGRCRFPGARARLDRHGPTGRAPAGANPRRPVGAARSGKGSVPFPGEEGPQEFELLVLGDPVRVQAGVHDLLDEFGFEGGARGWIRLEA